ncbi:MAG TPA: DUF3467 domain-containing protein [Balneolales bacterium]|nr:DUF3467 domain-containing protein [Balneolales bacterium]
MQEQQDDNQIDIELTEDEATGTYANLVMITHSPSEFILDFISMMPGVPKAKVVKRMILTPDHAKRLVSALGDNIKRYEEQFGEIEIENKPDLNMSYRGPIPEA